jgi:hypothetical protein
MFLDYLYLKPLNHLTATFAGIHLDGPLQYVYFYVNRKYMSATAGQN